MGDDEYDRVRRQVIHYLVALRGSPEHWKKARLVKLQCRKCHDLAAEVIETPYLFASKAVVHRGFSVGTGSILARSGDRDPGAHVSVLLTASQDDLVVACRCGRHRVATVPIFDAIAEGRTTIVLNTPDTQT